MGEKVKKFLAIFGFLVAAFVWAHESHATSYTFSILLSPSSTCTAGFSSRSISDWSATCSITQGLTNTDVGVNGIGMCASSSGVIGDIADELILKLGYNTYCWCKIYDPIVTKWYFLRPYTGTTTTTAQGLCLRDCSAACASSLSNATIKNTVLIGTSAKDGI